MIITSEADISKVPNAGDRRELRNFQRWLRLWPHYGYEMIQRPRWQKYLGISQEELALWNAALAKRTAFNGPAEPR